MQKAETSDTRGRREFFYAARRCGACKSHNDSRRRRGRQSVHLRGSTRCRFAGRWVLVPRRLATVPRHRESVLRLHPGRYAIVQTRRVYAASRSPGGSECRRGRALRVAGWRVKSRSPWRADERPCGQTVLEPRRPWSSEVRRWKRENLRARVALAPPARPWLLSCGSQPRPPGYPIDKWIQP